MGNYRLTILISTRCMYCIVLQNACVTAFPDRTFPWVDLKCAFPLFTCTICHGRRLQQANDRYACKVHWSMVVHNRSHCPAVDQMVVLMTSISGHRPVPLPLHHQTADARSSFARRSQGGAAAQEPCIS